MAKYQLAQLNVGTLRGPFDSPVVAEFVSNLEPLYKIAEKAPGFIWRPKESEDANFVEIFGDRLAAKMSVWDGIESLRGFVYRFEHSEMLRRRREWFERSNEAYSVLWWVPFNHRPDAYEASERLDHLKTHGPTLHAFTFQESFSTPE